LRRNEIQSTEGLEVPVNHPQAALFDQFLKERTYLKNVTDRTLVWYRVAFKNYAAVTAQNAAVLPANATLQHCSPPGGVVLPVLLARLDGFRRGQ
jgi:hypothetical protein